MQKLDDKDAPASAAPALCGCSTSTGMPAAQGGSAPCGCTASTPAAKPPPVETHCPVEATLSLIGGKYKALILWNLLSRTMRFSDLRRAVPCATPKMLTQQLREMEADGLIHREIFPVIPPRVEYSLTELGRSIRPVLEAMYAWGSGWLGRQGLCPSCSMKPLPDDAKLKAEL